MKLSLYINKQNCSIAVMTFFRLYVLNLLAETIRPERIGRKNCENYLFQKKSFELSLNMPS